MAGLLLDDPTVLQDPTKTALDALSTGPDYSHFRQEAEAEQELHDRLQKIIAEGFAVAATYRYASLPKRIGETFDPVLWLRVAGEVFHEHYVSNAARVLFNAAWLGHNDARDMFMDAVNPQDYENFLRPYAAHVARKQADSMVEAQRQAIEEALTYFKNNKVPPSTIEARLRTMYGMDRNGSNGYLAWLAKNVLLRPTRTLIHTDTVNDFVRATLARRARQAAGVNVWTAMNGGRQLMYMHAMKTGALPPDAMKTWVTAIDERVCPVCAPMDGVSVPIQESFEIVLSTKKPRDGKFKTQKMLIPPVHPNCRCTIVPTERLHQGIITRRARYDADHLKRASIVSQAEHILVGKADNPNEQRDPHTGMWIAGGAIAAGLVAGSVAVAKPQLARDVVQALRRVHPSRARMGESTGFEGLDKELLNWQTHGPKYEFRSPEQVASQFPLIGHMAANAPRMEGVTLHRGIKNFAYGSQFTPGAEVNIPISSWSEDPHVAEMFARMSGVTALSQAERRPTILHVRNPRSYLLENLGGEREHVISGRFRVNHSRMDEWGNHHVLLDHLDEPEQIGKARDFKAPPPLEEEPKTTDRNRKGQFNPGWMQKHGIGRHWKHKVFEDVSKFDQPHHHFMADAVGGALATAGILGAAKFLGKKPAALAVHEAVHAAPEADVAAIKAGVMAHHGAPHRYGADFGLMGQHPALMSAIDTAQPSEWYRGMTPPSDPSAMLGYHKFLQATPGDHIDLPGSWVAAQREQAEFGYAKPTTNTVVPPVMLHFHGTRAADQASEVPGLTGVTAGRFRVQSAGVQDGVHHVHLEHLPHPVSAVVAAHRSFL